MIRLASKGTTVHIPLETMERPCEREQVKELPMRPTKKFASQVFSQSKYRL